MAKGNNVKQMFLPEVYSYSSVDSIVVCSVHLADQMIHTECCAVHIVSSTAFYVQFIYTKLTNLSSHYVPI